VGACALVLWPLLTGHAAVAAFYDQVVGFHVVAQNASGDRVIAGLIGNLAKMDDITMVVAAAAVALVWSRRGCVALRAALPLALWLFAGLALLLVHRPLFDPHVLILAPPLALLGTLGLQLCTGWRWTGTLPRPRRGALLAYAMPLLVASTLVVALGLDIRDDWQSATTVPADRLRMVAALASSTRPGELVVTDDQYVAARAGCDTPPELVDTSLVRVGAGSLTALLVERVIQRDHVRVVLFASGRFDQVPGLRTWVETNFKPTATFGPGETLYEKAAAAGGRAPPVG
jgi:hypothetical protein